MTIALKDRLKRAMAGPPKVTGVALANACHVKPPSVSDWLSGKTKTMEASHLLAAAKFLGVNPSWLSSGVGPMHVTGRPSAKEVPLDGNADYPAIKRVRFKLSAGASGFGVEYLEGDGAPMVFERSWFDSRGFKPEALFAVRVSGASMESGLHAGDTVVVNTADTDPKDGEVSAVNYEGELIIKRMVRDAGQWWLTSDNPDKTRFPHKVCGDGVFVIGRVVHKQSERI